MNRKGDLFMLGINILFLIAVILVFWKLSVEFKQPNQEESLGTRQTALLQTYGTAEKMLLYLDTAATFAAYEAADTVLRRGGINIVSSPCGKYAGYQLWTSQRKKCIPDSDELYSEFARETIKVLRGMLGYPGMPPLAEYSTDVTVDDGIVLSATTDDRIVLPIATAKGTVQSRAAQAAQDEDAADLRAAPFEPDSALVDKVVVTQNKRDRTGPVGQIVILDAMQESADALYGYTEGSGSVHYFVLEDGTLVQLVPERLAALFCEECPPVGRIGIALEHAGQYSEEQMTTLAEVTADIQLRRDIRISNIKLLREVSEEENPENFDKASFLKQVGVAKSRQEQELEEDEPEEDEYSGIGVSWVAEDHTITSCWGQRKLQGRSDKHDGIDIDDTTSDKVYSFASGRVIDACETSGGGTLSGCSRHCRGFGTTVLIEHPDGSQARYSHMRSLAVRAGDEVEAGQLIGRIGNTGCSTGSHLDLKIFEPGQTGAEQGQNPFCYYPDNVLRNMNLVGASCSKYNIDGSTVLSHSNPVLQKECQGIDPLRQSMGCFGSFQVADQGGKSGTLAKTLENLEKDNLIPYIEQVGNEEGIDPNLMIAFIAQESRGRKNIVSASGCAGLAQFCLGTARDYSDVFGSGFKQCSCSGKECTAEQAGCAGDPRFDPEKSIRTLPLLLKDKMKNFEGMTDKVRLGIAAYNGGEGTIRRAIEKTGRQDPSWEDVSAALDRDVIDRSLCPVHSSFCTAKGQEDKIKEIRNYVPGVMSFYTALGGSLPGAFSDTYCPDQQLNVKEIGRYEFEPNFKVEIPNVLSPVQRLTAWADSVYGRCTGREDNRECLQDEADRFNRQQDSVEVVSCDEIEEERIIETQYRQFLQDCRDNKQSDCYCPFSVDRDAQLQLYGDTVRVVIGGEPVSDMPPERPGALFADSPDEEPEEVILSLDTSEGQYSLWEAAEDDEGDVEHFDEYIRGVPADRFMLYKGEQMRWISDSGNAQACGVYKTQHHVCARISERTYKISEGGTAEPVVRFALYLEDTHDPEPVTRLSAIGGYEDDVLDTIAPGLGDVYNALEGEPVRVSFEPSGSEDISYYLARCDDLGNAVEPWIVNQVTQHIPGREYNDRGEDVRIGETIETVVQCEGLSSRVSVRPVDISGNIGNAAETEVQDSTGLEVTD